MKESPETTDIQSLKLNISLKLEITETGICLTLLSDKL